VTTKVGYSRLFCEEHFGSAKQIMLHFRLHETGLKKSEAEAAECVLSDELRARYGDDLVLTNPRKGRVTS
jgi:hypothetical protein